MHRNYFLFEAQVKQLNEQLKHKRITDIYTFRKNELVIDLDSMALTINISREYPYLLLQQLGNIKQPKLSLLTDAKTDGIESVEIQPFDKRVVIKTDSHLFEVIFFGRHPNVVLKNKNGYVLGAFKESNEPAPVQHSDKYDFRTISKKTLNSLWNNEPQQQLQFFLKRHFGGVNQRFIDEIAKRMNAQTDATLKSLSVSGMDTLFSVFEMIKNLMSERRAHIYYEENKLHHITLFPMQTFNTLNFDTYDNINSGWLRFIEEAKRTADINKLKTSCQKALNKRESFLNNTLKKIEEASNINERKKHAELIGNLLLTLKHTIKPHSSKVSLKNIFSDNQELIEVKLDPRKSVSENAKAYFEKYKDIAEKRFVLETKKAVYENELAAILAVKEQLSATTKLSVLNKIRDRLIDMKLLQDNRSSPTMTRTALRYAFNRIILDKQWDIFIGKNGQNNDLLTFSFANKWDMWFHAQGVPGSHVVLRLETKDTIPPGSVLERAAQLAAANSKAQHSETVPVVYTKVKYVHRVRKAPPGTVNISREKVLFVKPLRIS